MIPGAGVVIAFVIFAALSGPASSAAGRVLIALFCAATLKTPAQEPGLGSAGYPALAAAAFFPIGVALLPDRRPAASTALAVQRRET